MATYGFENSEEKIEKKLKENLQKFTRKFIESRGVRWMVAERLQERLCAELSKITKNIDFEDQDGNQSELSVFKQCLPRKENEDDSDPFPFCVVKLGENDVKSVSENQRKL